ncbi:MAG TPA: hypothetical protein PKB06_00240 [Actinotalea sp.]|nr:hypothetical protein [Actinotalea sp.]
MTARGLPPDEPGDDPDLTAQWDDIVARLGDLTVADVPDAEGGAPSAPAGPDDAGPASDGTGDEPDSAGATQPRRRRSDRPGSYVVRPATPPTSDPRSWAPDPDVEEAEDHFEPPEPGPVFGGDPLLTMAWVVVVGAPTLAVVALVAWQDIPVWLLQAAGAAFLLAVGLLIWRMPHRRDTSDDDPGAVV